jgi:hypothetical protein
MLNIAHREGFIQTFQAWHVSNSFVCHRYQTKQLSSRDTQVALVEVAHRRPTVAHLGALLTLHQKVELLSY